MKTQREFHPRGAICFLHHYWWIVLVCFGLTIACVAGETNLFGRHGPDEMSDSEYRSAVLKWMIDEASEFVRLFKLPGPLPLTTNTLSKSFVGMRALIPSNHGFPAGSFRTAKYVFAFASAGKLISIGRLDLLNHAHLSNEELTSEYRKIEIPRSVVDTNAGWNAILPYARAGILDFDRINADCKLTIKGFEWAGMAAPIYSAVWTRDDMRVASISVLLPETLLSYRIEEPTYNLRQSLPAYQAKARLWLERDSPTLKSK